MLLLWVGWIFGSGSGECGESWISTAKVCPDLYLCFLFGLEVFLFIYLFIFSVLYEYLDFCGWSFLGV